MREDLDLYTADLESVNENTIEAFLGLHLPVEERPTEGQRFDFKQELPSDLASDVAAFANTYGGIIIIGVSFAEIGVKRSKNIPGALTGIVGAELKLRVTHMIRDAVYPVPVFDVAERRLKTDSTKAIVVVRVESGSHPPYMHLPTKRIQIRRGDSMESVSPFELESLLQRRNKDADTQRAARASDIHVLQHYPEHRQPEPARCRNFNSISVIPWDFGLTRLDLSLERKIEKYMRVSFLRDRMQPLLTLPLKKTIRARWAEFEKMEFSKLIHRKWRITHEGVVQFVSAIPYSEPEIIGNLMLDFFSTMKLSELFLSDNECFGNVDLRVDLSCIDARMEMKTPEIDVESESSDPDMLAGIRGIEMPVKNRNSWSYHTTTSFEQLSHPVDLASLIFSEHLREIWQCEFSFERLREQIDVFWMHQFLPNLPKDVR